MTVKALCTRPNRPPFESIAVNPGEWFGKLNLLGISDGMNVTYYIVEAASEGDAVDVLVESDHGERLRIDVALEGHDYGEHFSVGDHAHGHEITVAGYYNLKGELVPDEVGKSLSPPSTTGQGVLYDTDWLVIESRSGLEVTYVDPEDPNVPVQGLPSSKYEYKDEELIHFAPKQSGQFGLTFLSNNREFYLEYTEEEATFEGGPDSDGSGKFESNIVKAAKPIDMFRFGAAILQNVWEVMTPEERDAARLYLKPLLPSSP